MTNKKNNSVTGSRKKIIREKSFVGLAKAVRALNFKDGNDLLKINNFSVLIFNEWMGLKKIYQRKLKRSKLSDISLHAQYEAEVDILIGLLFLLNQKTANFLCCMSNLL